MIDLMGNATYVERIDAEVLEAAFKQMIFQWRSHLIDRQNYVEMNYIVVAEQGIDVQGWQQQLSPYLAAYKIKLDACINAPGIEGVVTLCRWYHQIETEPETGETQIVRKENVYTQIQEREAQVIEADGRLMYHWVMPDVRTVIVQPWLNFWLKLKES